MYKRYFGIISRLLAFLPNNEKQELEIIIFVRKFVLKHFEIFAATLIFIVYLFDQRHYLPMIVFPMI